MKVLSGHTHWDPVKRTFYWTVNGRTYFGAGHIKLEEYQE